MNHVLHKRDGGLSSCEVCGGAEATLPTECPGVRMGEDLEKAVSDARLDFKGGRWVALKKGSES